MGVRHAGPGPLLLHGERLPAITTRALSPSPPRCSVAQEGVRLWRHVEIVISRIVCIGRHCSASVAFRQFLPLDLFGGESQPLNCAAWAPLLLFALLTIGPPAPSKGRIYCRLASAERWEPPPLRALPPFPFFPRLPSAVDNVILRSIIFVLIWAAIQSLLSLPVSIYSTFVLEEKHGFNKQVRRVSPIPSSARFC